MSDDINDAKGTSGAESSRLVMDERPRQAVHFEDLWKAIGGFGRYPVLIFSFMCYVTICVDLQQFIQTYYGSAPNFHCKPWDSNSNSTTCGINKCGCTNCTYEFDGEFTSVVSEWMLICDHGHLKPLSQSVFYAGLLVGSVVIGKLSDHFGRKPVLFFSLFLMMVFGFGSAFANSLALFVVMRFGAGFGTAGALLVRFVYSMEVSTIQLRTALGSVSNLFIVIGAVILTGMAYLIRDWRYLMLSATIPCILPLLFWRWIPESPAWLIAKGKLHDAQKVFESFASASGYSVDPEQLAAMIKDVQHHQEQQAADAAVVKSGVLDLVKTKKMLKRTLILSYNWFVNSVVFYGITLNAKNLGGSLHLNVFILFAVGFPGALVLWIAFKKCGRRIGYGVFMLFCGLTSLLVLAVPNSQGDSPFVKVLAVLGVFNITITFPGIYIYATELNPTLLRNLALGIGSMASRIGGIIAPYIVFLNDFMINLPFIVFGIMAISAGLLAALLPETLFSPMPQTVDEVESWDEDYGLPCRKRTKEPEEVVMENGKKLNENMASEEITEL